LFRGVQFFYLIPLAEQQHAYKDLPDEELMKLVVMRDRVAFGEVYDRYSDRLLRYFYRMLWQNRELAEDLVQDLFLKIIKKPESYDPSRPFRVWVFSVAANMCKNEYKKAEVRQVAASEIRYTSRTASDADELSDLVEYADFSTALEREVKILEPHHRDTFILRFRQGLSIKEISQVLECSEGTVKSRLFYATRKLAEKLESFRVDRKNEVPGKTMIRD
jgi:RNA polymerase sigma factor (sigma-70 family)